MLTKSPTSGVGVAKEEDPADPLEETEARSKGSSSGLGMENKLERRYTGILVEEEEEEQVGTKSKCSGRSRICGEERSMAVSKSIPVSLVKLVHFQFSLSASV